HLPPSAFVAFLQNHDQIGNRAFGARLSTLVDAPALAAAMAFLLLSPHVPLLFMGEEYGETRPVLYFTAYTHSPADAVREGRRREFPASSSFADPARRAAIPDPNDPATFAASRPDPAAGCDATRRRIAELIALRKREVIPWLARRSRRSAQ